MSGVGANLTGEAMMDLSLLWSLDPTAVWVSAIVLALGLLWMYVMLSRAPASVERDLTEDVGTRGGSGGGKGSAGKRGGRNRGKGKTVSVGRPPTRAIHTEHFCSPPWG